MELQGHEPNEDTFSAAPGRGDRSAAIWIFVFLFCVYALSAGGHVYSTDEEAMYAVTSSLIGTGQPFVEIDASNDGHVRPAVTVGRDGNLAVFASWGQSLLGLPLYSLGSATALAVGDPHDEMVRRIFTGWTGAAATAAGAAIFFLLARLVGADRRGAFVLTLVYALATFAFPHAKTFFSEPMTTTLLLSSWYFALKDQGDRRRLILSGVLAGASLLWRPSTVVMIPPIAIWLVIQAARRGDALRRRGLTALAPLVWFGVGAAIPLIFLATSNWWRFGSAISFGYPKPSFALEGLPKGLFGLFLSPGKSLFLFAPVAIAGVLALFRIRNHRAQLLLMFTSAMVSALLFGAYTDWHGDHTWGPRYLVMSLPLMILGLAQLMDARRWRQGVIGLGILGFMISSLGVIINFNSYFVRAADQLPRGYQEGTDDLIYWRYTHFDPYWSQVTGHARLIPSTLKSTALDMLEPRMGPFPSAPDDIYDWYLGAPLEADSWVVWLRQARGPKWLALLALVFVTGGLFAYRMAWRAVKESR